MLKTVLIAIGLLMLAVLGLSVRIIWGKDKQFGAKDVGESSAMRQRGIYCAKSQDRLVRRQNPNQIDVKSL